MNIENIESNMQEDDLYHPLTTPSPIPNEAKGIAIVDRSLPSNKEIQKKITKAFNFLMKHKKIKAFGSIYALEKALGLSNATIANAKKHQRPTYSTVVKMAHLAGERAHKLIGDL